MKIKKIFVIMLCVFTILSSFSYAEASIDSIILSMSGVKNDPGGSGEGIPKVINIIIGLLQVAGTGISIIVVTIYGIKYIVASVDEKANIKKQAIPIVIGCVLLFGAVNLIAAVQEFALVIS